MIKQESYSLDHIDFEGKTASSPKHMRCPDIDGTSMIDEGPVHAFIAWVLELAGLPVDAYRAAPLHRRLGACLRALKAGSITEAENLMQRPEMAAKALESLLIGVTEFFRDAAVFDALRKIIATELAIQQEPLRVWSAGCSNGAELYSLAMLLAELGYLDHALLVGTDCRMAAIDRARSGLFSEADVKSIDVSLRNQYMHNAGAQWRVVDSLRRRIVWQTCDLLSGCEEGPWDIILWRNMAIYLSLKSSTQVWTELVKGLRPGGLLVVGKAEQPPVTSGLTCISRCIYRLQRERTEAAG